jgi:hypothetical protein
LAGARPVNFDQEEMPLRTYFKLLCDSGPKKLSYPMSINYGPYTH